MAWLTILSTAAKSAFQWVTKNPNTIRVILEIGGVIAIVICLTTHCGSRNGITVGKTDTVRVTTTVLKYDSSVHSLIGDTIAYYQALLSEPKWKRPEIRYVPNSSVSDSLRVTLLSLKQYDELLKNCDEQYRTDYAYRSYGDTLRSDSAVVWYDFSINGRLASNPKFSYKILTPEKTITIKETVTNTITNRKKIYLGGGIGARLPWESDRLGAIVGSARLGYSDRKNQSYGLRGDFSQSDYTVSFEYTKSFSLGK